MPLILIFFVLYGLRFVFDLPAELRANWPPQVIVDREKHQALALARKITVSLVWPAIVIVVLPIYSYLRGWKTGVGHTLVLLVWSFEEAAIPELKFLNLTGRLPYS